MPPRAPLVVTIHDVAWVDDPRRHTRQGARVLRRSLDVARDHAVLVVTSSEASRRDLEAHGIDVARLRVVPLGVDHRPADPSDVAAVRRRYALPPSYALFVGTLEPRKNLRRLAMAMPRVSTRCRSSSSARRGWGDATDGVAGDVRFLGFVPASELPALYAGADVFAYPSEQEGFGLPVLEAMDQGTPVVTSAGTSTEEVAAGAAVLVDPFDVDAIAAGIDDARARSDDLAAAGRARAATMTWDAAARRTYDVYREAAGALDGLRAGVNLLWCLPGAVGGSEEYLVRQLDGLHDVAPEIDATLFVVPGFAAAHPDLAARHQLVAVLPRRSPAQPTCARRGNMVGVAAARRRRRPPRRRYRAAAIAEADPADDPRRAVPHVPRLPHCGQAPVPAGRCASLDPSRRCAWRSRRSTSARPSSTATALIPTASSSCLMASIRPPR